MAAAPLFYLIRLIGLLGAVGVIINFEIEKNSN